MGNVIKIYFLRLSLLPLIFLHPNIWVKSSFNYPLRKVG